MNFSTLENRVNQVVGQRFTNCVALINGFEVAGVFDSGYQTNEFVGGIRLMLNVAETDLAAVFPDDPVVVDGVAYTIAYIRKDGSGRSDLALEAV
jgi:hypothetical protein